MDACVFFPEYFAFYLKFRIREIGKNRFENSGFDSKGNFCEKNSVTLIFFLILNLPLVFLKKAIRIPFFLKFRFSKISLNGNNNK
jgi:hypothetical protein